MIQKDFGQSKSSHDGSIRDIAVNLELGLESDHLKRRMALVFNDIIFASLYDAYVLVVPLSSALCSVRLPLSDSHLQSITRIARPRGWTPDEHLHIDVCR